MKSLSLQSKLLKQQLICWLLPYLDSGTRQIQYFNRRRFKMVPGSKDLGIFYYIALCGNW